ncbi:uncharacterized protein CIMG_12873 [Coccidioides immitis RS]|uniref:Uncharacterized protein n=1 Tax=Coccidioides immitis (strain RS) TaxID=246410 RepID=J3KH06_COCIM|nr:uncharacterized protein CIMG_12873 [Coccidioides immitis RS]EAS35091.3 hypothetical protein CIMG_12873 [Coccidioides immitis RS]
MRDIYCLSSKVTAERKGWTASIPGVEGRWNPHYGALMTELWKIRGVFHRFWGDETIFGGSEDVRFGRCRQWCLTTGFPMLVASEALKKNPETMKETVSPDTSVSIPLKMMSLSLPIMFSQGP